MLPLYIAVHQVPPLLVGPSPEKTTGFGGTEFKEKELEELVVVLFAKVEIPRP
jgi:hypothetical protein